ncbi:hypothetical protein [Stieleria varia]|uniref:Uncharacterized protein n=1 Tax=Stieleria varia TaxID=2528005 RepID=A0A5C6AFX7_9BACT|nr:hypothetical protein [Stieleria varia]TWT98509.1 hypothetical protein Pla52n_50230 [Stieleria varia]
MGYTGHRSTPPRPFRVIFGGVIATLCAVSGTFLLTDRFHRATAMSSGPTEMDWETFIQNGPGEFAFITLTGVDVYDSTIDSINEIDPDELDALIKDFDPGSPEQVQQLMAAHFGGSDPLAAVLNAFQPPKVIPAGADPNQILGRLTLPFDFELLEEARRQIDENGALTGLLRRPVGHNMMFPFLGDDLNASDQDQPRANFMYEIVPTEHAPDLDMASNQFLFAGLGLSLSLILCCSGGAGFSTLWYFPLASIISLAGYPMRYGRGGVATRVVYFAIGVVMIGWGYRMMVTRGHFGTVDGIPLFQSMGFNAMFIGVAACMSVPCQLLTRRFFESMDPEPKKPEKRLSYEQACGMTPVVETATYNDDDLLESSAVVVPPGLRDHIDRLIAAGFTEPGRWVWHRNDDVIPAAIQLGCQEMIVSDMEWSDETKVLRTRLVSVLGDGMPIVTLSNAFEVADSRVEPSAVYQKAMSSEPAEMLAMHLEKVVSLAESRQTSVIAFEPGEARGVAKLGRRAVAEIRSRDGEISQVVGEAKYGRFSFPPNEVLVTA